MLRPLALALAVATAAQAQPFATVHPLGPLAAEADGAAVALHPLAAAADGDGWVVFATSMQESEPSDRWRPWALRLGADGAVVAARRADGGAGRVHHVFEPKAAPTMRPDGDGWLVGGVFEDVAPFESTPGTRHLRALRIAPDLSAGVVAERALGPRDNVRLADVLRLGEDLVLFSGGALVQGGRRTVPVALAVGPGGEKSLLPPADFNEEVTTAAVRGDHVILGGWAQTAEGRRTVVRVFDDQLDPVNARTLDSHGFPQGPRIVPIDDARVFLAAALPDSTGPGRERLLVAAVSVPAAEVVGTAWAAERSVSDYALDGFGVLPGTGLVMRARAPAGEGRSRAVLTRHPEGGAPGWTVPVGSVVEREADLRVLAVGDAGALSAVRDSAGTWRLELARLSATRPSPAWLAPLGGATVADESAFDAYVRAMLAAGAPAERGAALSAYGDALDASADSAAVSRELQRQAAALLAADGARGLDALALGPAALVRRVRPGLPTAQQACVARVFLWRVQRDRALAERAPVPGRPATDCD